MDNLTTAIEQTEFMQMDTVYGGASPGQRYYTHGISVNLDAVQQEVIYQSFPGAEPMPAGMRTLITVLNNLVKEKAGK